MTDINGNESEIANFYRDRSIFITGATGFMGKVLVEKLLRSCSGVQNIYVLLRSKKGLNPHSRLDELLDAKIFDKIKEENPKALNKVVAIQGDITLPGLGICDADLNRLVADVSVVFHSAATVKFDEPLKTSVQFNVIGTRRLVEICHKMQKLVALIHVSTAYANCDRYEVDECLYPSSVSPQKVIDLCSWMTNEQLEAVTPPLLGDRPNTYTYTKALAETLLVNECGSLPVAIVRPSIVTASWKEPLPGWVDNLNGPTGLVVAIGKGILRHMSYKSKGSADIIPVDTVINLMIASVWYTATRRPNGVLVYNCTSGSLNGINWDQIRNMFDILLQYPSAQIYRYPGFVMRENRFVNRMAITLDHTIPAYLFDGLMYLLGRKPIMVKLYERLHRSVKAFEWFTTHEWKFSNDNVLMLIDQLKDIDKEIFHFDIRDIHWRTYWIDYTLGTRKYILKEECKTLPEARSNMSRIRNLNRLFYCVVGLGLCHIFSISSVIRNMFF